MRGFLFVCSILGVMGLAFWAYQENYRTQQSLREVRDLNADIGAAYERLNVLRAEWAYLNRPDRLRDLTELNFDRLGLLPLMPDAFGRIEQIAYPALPLGPIIDPIEVSSDNAPGDIE
ncbi:MAG: cell division protein FtsL [Thalassobium sp.]|nr:MAG: cell division protein FtsL [Thalassobium sp.]|tara:strand:- start:33 stop:386 length:354 start_codon:yes stop_codon:yes gene_type:complete